MRAELTRLAVALVATSTFVSAAQAQTTACVNDAPNPYHMVNDWAHTPRPWAQTNNVFVDAKDNVWVFDRCEDRGCAGSSVAPIWELSPDGKVMKNFGARVRVPARGRARQRRQYLGRRRPGQGRQRQPGDEAIRRTARC